jgi:3-isopropylmalate dehydrogenase
MTSIVDEVPSALQLPTEAVVLGNVLPDWHQHHPTSGPAPERLRVGVLPGEGIGPEIIAATIEVMEAVGALLPAALDLSFGGAIGVEAERRSGSSLTSDVIEFCDAIFSHGGTVLCGPGGNRFVYNLRRRFDLYCKFTPIVPVRAIAAAGPVRSAARTGVDMVIVRENASGLYFGHGGRDTDPDGCEIATHRFSYRRDEVERIVHVAGRLARQRRGRLCMAVKPNGVPEISALWSDVLAGLLAEHPLETVTLEIDNALYQIVASAQRFDVIVAPNLFGDVLSDTAALLLGSRGMSYSGNYGPKGRAVFQTGHGCAHDLAGRDVANPVGQIHSAAMMLREVYGAHTAALAITDAVEEVLRSGARTVDISEPRSRVVGTREMGTLIAAAVRDRTPAAVAAAAGETARSQ